MSISSEHRTTLLLALSSVHHQVAGLAAGTVGWVLSVISMGLAAWRVWHLGSNPPYRSSLVCVGMGKTCVYQHANHFCKDPLCYGYASYSASLPLRLRGAHGLLLTAILLGLLGLVSAVVALRTAYVGLRRREATTLWFLVAGALHITAGLCVYGTVGVNYLTVMREEGISFPPSFQLPFKPDTQEVGRASVVASLGALLLLVSGFTFLSYNSSSQNRVHPEFPGRELPDDMGSPHPP
ncbi:claudin-34-like [Tamandua tetradactyla]|uniref:claudin-34-like n=1 Tax=Tamandua tetradactyla TaxID=48850 RepID=UPI0040538323